MFSSRSSLKGVQQKQRRAGCGRLTGELATGGFKNRGFTSRGFTLVELIVVVAIVAILAALLVPMIHRALRSASGARLAADLQTLGGALEAYKQDFGDYPRLRPMYNPSPSAANPVRATSEVGSVILTWGLIGPYPATPDPANNVVVVDGAVGPGFRVRPQSGGPGPDGQLNTADDVGLQGKVYGPYLDLSKFKTKPVTLNDTGGTARTYHRLVDGYGNPILYFVARPGPINIQQATSAATIAIKPKYPARPDVVNLTENMSYVQYAPSNDSRADRGLYNLQDDFATMASYVLSTGSDAQYLGAGTLNPAVVRAQMQYRLEQAGNFTGPYILWSAGPDGFFFTADDVTNFNK